MIRGHESTRARGVSGHATDDVATVAGSSAASNPNKSVGPAGILPILHASGYRKIATCSRQRGFVAVLTSTPYKQCLNKILTKSGFSQSKATKNSMYTLHCEQLVGAACSAGFSDASNVVVGSCVCHLSFQLPSLAGFGETTSTVWVSLVCQYNILS